MTNDSIEIINLLRDARLGWIADEIVESIALGRQTTKDFREPGMTRPTRASAVEQLSPEEEMELIVETLAQYFIVMPAAWEVARLDFAKPDTFAAVKLDEERLLRHSPSAGGQQSFAAALGIAGEGEESFHDFSASYRNESLPSLTRVLKSLWPHGGDDFEQKFGEQEAETK